MTDPCFETVTSLRQQIRSGNLCAVDLTAAFLQRIDSHKDLSAFITVRSDEALEQAARIDTSIQNGRSVGPLAGIPISIKDAIPTKDIRTTCNSRTKIDWIPDTEPDAVTRLRAADAIILGKANCNEYLGIPSADDLFPRPRNPYNPDYVSIGSSSGSGPTVAAGLCAASVGTDGAGSVRLPAAQNGLVGLKATRGIIKGMENEPEPTLQVIGPFTRSVSDAAAFLDVLAYTPSEQRLNKTSETGYYERSLSDGKTDWKIGVPWRYLETSPAEPEVIAAFENALNELRDMGAKIIDISLLGLAEGRMATFVVLYTEHHAQHARTLSTDLANYGESARLYAMQGAFISAVDYLNAIKFGRILRKNIDEAFTKIDAIAMPTSPFVTAEAARKPSEHRQGMNTVFTGPFNLSGHPALSVTCGVSQLDIPIGMQFVGRFNDEVTLFRLGHQYQVATRWHELRPSAFGPRSLKEGTA